MRRVYTCNTKMERELFLVPTVLPYDFLLRPILAVLLPQILPAFSDMPHSNPSVNLILEQLRQDQSVSYLNNIMKLN